MSQSCSTRKLISLTSSRTDFGTKINSPKYIAIHNKFYSTRIDEFPNGKTNTLTDGNELDVTCNCRKRKNHDGFMFMVLLKLLEYIF